jgi:integral membrane sensor domain MASE1
MRRFLLLSTILVLAAAPALARDSLGIFGTWGAFRDSSVPRCYAIAMAAASTMRRDYQPYAGVAVWPRRQIRNQVHFRVSRQLQPAQTIVLTVGDKRFELIGGGGDAWAADRRMDAAIVAAMRSAGSMTLFARDAAGGRFSNTWPLAGAASAMDAAAIGCARTGR